MSVALSGTIGTSGGSVGVTIAASATTSQWLREADLRNATDVDVSGLYFALLVLAVMALTGAGFTVFAWARRVHDLR